MLITQKIFRWFFPPTCILCHYPADRPQDLCQACFNELPIIPQSCPRCAKSFMTASFICLACATSPPPYDRMFALFSYQPPITKLIMELKFHQRLVNARILGELMTEAIQQRWYVNKRLPDVIIPIPLHTKRLRERGYNQAIEICRPINKTLNIPIDTTHCLRIKYTQAQATLAVEQRLQNMKNAFSIRGDFTGRHVAIFDDVTTTGQTILEFSQAVKLAGAKQIDIWCCAKTSNNND